MNILWGGSNWDTQRHTKREEGEEKKEERERNDFLLLNKLPLNSDTRRFRTLRLDCRLRRESFSTGMWSIAELEVRLFVFFRRPSRTLRAIRRRTVSRVQRKVDRGRANPSLHATRRYLEGDLRERRQPIARMLQSHSWLATRTETIGHPSYDG